MNDLSKRASTSHSIASGRFADEVVPVSDRGLGLVSAAGETWFLPLPTARAAVYVHRADGGPLTK